jgi:hypothetical protein
VNYSRVVDLYCEENSTLAVGYDIDSHVLWYRDGKYDKDNAKMKLSHRIVFYVALFAAYWFQPSYRAVATALTDTLLMLLINALVILWFSNIMKKQAQIGELLQKATNITNLILLKNLPAIKKRFSLQISGMFASMVCCVLGIYLFFKSHYFVFAAIELIFWMLLCVFFAIRHKLFNKKYIIRQIEQGTLPLAK